MRRAIAAAVIFAAGGAAIAFASGSDPGSAGSGRWESLARSPLSRTEVGAARIGRYAYVVGGFEQRSGVTTAAVLRYDLARNSWRRVRDLPIGVNHTAVAAHDGMLYVLGGFTEPRDFSQRTNRLYRYHPSRNTWRRLRDAPTHRGAHTMQAIGGRLYAVGGTDQSHEPTGSLEIYDIRRDRWSAGPAMPTPREHLASAVAGGRLFVLAGRTAREGNFTTLEAYDPGSRSWSRLPDMRTPRGGIAGAAIDRNRIVVFGGEASTTIKEVELYDVSARRWSPLADMRTPRHGLGGVAYRGRVFALEGGPQPGFFFSNRVEALSVP